MSFSNNGKLKSKILCYFDCHVLVLNKKSVLDFNFQNAIVIALYKDLTASYSLDELAGPVLCEFTETSI